MKSLYAGFKRFINDETGVTAIEYGLLAALIAVVIIAAVTSAGTRISCTFQRVADCLVGSTNGTCPTPCP
ncbi:MAG: hypothetical protein RLZZ379_1340 [Pseudomonadota bacterium]